MLNLRSEKVLSAIELACQHLCNMVDSSGKSYSSKQTSSWDYFVKEKHRPLPALCFNIVALQYSDYVHLAN